MHICKIRKTKPISCKVLVDMAMDKITRMLMWLSKFSLDSGFRQNDRSGIGDYERISEANESKMSSNYIFNRMVIHATAENTLRVKIRKTKPSSCKVLVARPLGRVPAKSYLFMG